MKYAKLLAAAAIVAAGVSAQAEDQTSATYCVITLPVAYDSAKPTNYNLYGVSVNPQDATYAEILGLPNETTFLNTSNGGIVYGDTTALPKSAVWYGSTAGSPEFLYQFGADASTGTDTYTALKGATTAMAFKKDLTLASFTPYLSVGSYKVHGAKANEVSFWDATTQTYKTYYYKSNSSGWREVGSSANVANPASIPIPAGSAVFVQISSQAAENVVFTF